MSLNTIRFKNNILTPGDLDVGGAAIVDDVDSKTSTALLIGKATATKVEIANAGIETEVQGSLTVQQDLVVNGTTTSVNTTNVNVADAYIYSNNGYTTNSATTGGAVVNYFPTTVTDTIAASGFVAGAAATSNPNVATVAAATFSLSDIIQISGANNPTNNGIFEVLSHVANVLTIRGVGLTGTVQDFSQSDFVTDTTVAGTITKINIAALRIGSDGVWENTVGSTTALTYNDIVDVASVVPTAIVGTGALDNGSITANFGTINNGASSITTTGQISGGQVTVDQIDINSGLITMTGTTGNNQIVLVDNLADAFSIQESTNKYLTFTTTNGSEALSVSKNILPSTSNTINLGSGSLAFNHGYFGGIVEVNDLDSRTASTLLLGKGVATRVEIANAAITTEIQGPLTVSETTNLVGVTTMGTGGTNYTLPTTRGTNTQVLTTNGSGVVSWADSAGGSSGADAFISRQRTIASTVSTSSINVWQGTGATTEIITDTNITFATGAGLDDGTFTINSGFDGEYHIQCNVLIGNGIGAADVVTWKINKGTTYNSTNLVTGIVNPYDNQSVELTMSCLATLVAGDVITFWIDTAGGSAINAKIGTTCTIYKLGGPVGSDGAVGGNGVSITNITAGEFENPGVSGWSVNALAPLTADAIDQALLIRAFDPTTSEGVGWIDLLPVGSTTMDITITTRAATGPGSTLTGIFTIEYRKVSGTIGTWQSHTLDTTSYTNANGTGWLNTITTVGYTDPTTNFIAGETYQFELVRDAPSDTLTTDIFLSNMSVEYSPLSAVNGSLQSSYNSSTTPEITTDATRQALTIKNGSGADTDNNLEIVSSSDVINFAVTGNGAVTIGDGATDYTLPTTRASAGQVLTDVSGNGTITWAATNPDPIIDSYTSTATLTIDSDTYAMAVITAQAAALTIAAPTGTPTQGRKLTIRIKDNATARAITWDAIFRAMGTTLLTTTTISKILYIECIYNATDTKWDVVAVSEEV